MPTLPPLRHAYFRWLSLLAPRRFLSPPMPPPPPISPPPPPIFDDAAFDAITPLITPLFAIIDIIAATLFSPFDTPAPFRYYATFRRR
jgi:hypothetical protein